MLPLKLSVTPGNWQKFIARRFSASFHRVAKKIFQRDRYTCQYCGFEAKQYMDVVNHDGDYKNNSAKNLVTACCFCSQCLFMDSVGLDNISGGQLIYLPEITQNQLNSFCHVLFCVIGVENPYQGCAQIAYRTLKQRAKIVQNVFGETISEPKALGRLILEYQAQKQKVVADKVFDGLRLLPIHTMFHTQLAAWSQSAMSQGASK